MDLLDRSGEPGPDNFPYRGKNNIFQRFMRNTDLADFNMSVDYAFELEYDFDADRLNPIQLKADEWDESRYEEEERGEVYEKYSIVKHSPFTKCPYLRRLEDIHDEYLEKYIGNVVYRFANHSNSSRSFFNYKKMHVTQATLTSVDDAEDVTELADLLMIDRERDEWSDADKQYAMDNLPYVLKRLQSLSSILKVHIPSYIVAYVKAVAFNKMRTESVKTLTCHDVIRQGVYAVDKLGNPTKLIEVKNKNKYAIEAFDWITGNMPNYSSHYKNCLDFIHYCDVLNVDLQTEDLLYVNTDYVNSLVITTVTSNKVFNQNVFKALKSNSTTLQEDTMSEDDIIRNTMMLVSEACDKSTVPNNIFYQITTHHPSINSTDEERRNQTINLYQYIAVVKMGLQFDPYVDKVTYDNGFMHVNGNLVLLPVKHFMRDSKSSFHCLVHEMGVVVQLTDGDRLNWITAFNAIDNINRMRNADDDIRLMTWSVF